MCEQCEVMTINGVLCHEIGCPAAWKDYKRNCRWCGQEFTPENVNQTYCSEQCSNADFSQFVYYARRERPYHEDHETQQTTTISIVGIHHATRSESAMATVSSDVQAG